MIVSYLLRFKVKMDVDILLWISYNSRVRDFWYNLISIQFSRCKFF